MEVKDDAFKWLLDKLNRVNNMNDGVTCSLEIKPKDGVITYVLRSVSTIEGDPLKGESIIHSGTDLDKVAAYFNVYTSWCDV